MRAARRGPTMLRRIKGCERREDKTAACAPPEIPPVASSPAPPLWAAERSALEVTVQARGIASEVVCLVSDTPRALLTDAPSASGKRSARSARRPLVALCLGRPPQRLARGGHRTALTRSLALRGEGGTDHLSWGFFQASTVRRGSGLHRYLLRDSPRGPPRARHPTRCPPGLRRCSGLSASTGSSADGVDVGSPTPPPARLGARRDRAGALSTSRAAPRSLDRPSVVSVLVDPIPPLEVLRVSPPMGWPRGPRASPSTARHEG